MKNLSSRQTARSRGSALLLVLAFLLLLTALVIGFLTSSTLEDEFSSASLNQGKVDVVAQGAAASIISDLQQEIVAGSNSTTVTPSIPTLATGYYYPNSPLTVIPAMVVPNYTPGGSTTIVGTGMEDLVKISYPTPFWPNNAYYNNTSGPNRASSISTTSNSLNNRSVTPARWNKPLLMAPTSTSNLAPSASGFTAPDWIYVARDGSNPTTWSTTYAYNAGLPPTTSTTAGTTGCNAVTERYAYAIYDEGSTLDMNVVGSPSYSSSTISYSALQPYKNALAYADLTQLPGLKSLSASQQVVLINAIVGWRNGTALLTKSNSAGFPNSYNFAATGTTTSATNPFDLDMLNNTGGFLGIGGSWLSLNSASPALETLVKSPNYNQYANQTDNAFASRQQLLQFFLQGLGENTTFTGSNVSLATLENIMPYLGTFSRDISQPSYAPNPSRPVVLAASAGGNNGALAPGSSSAGSDNTVNPPFLSVTATSAFTRNDGSTAVVGEPLVKKRFALNRLAWLTPQGPSASRTIPTTAPAVGSQNYDMWQLVNTYGIPASFLAQGTAANIQAYFGLTWSNNQWYYNVHNGTSGTGASGLINTLANVKGFGRDPDFFELLKATITVGSIGKALSNGSAGVEPDLGGTAPATNQPYNYNYYAESSVDYQVLQIGANIIAQFQPANLAPQINFWDGADPNASSTNPHTFVGVENLPYLSMVSTGAIELAPPTPLPRSYTPASVSPPVTASVNATGTGYGANAIYETSPTNDAASFTTAKGGLGALMQVPVIWNPHDPSSAPGTQGPTKLRILADGTTPNQVGSGSYTTFEVYAAAANLVTFATGTTTVSGNSTSPPISGYTYSGATGTEEIDLTGISSSLTKELCPEPVALFRPKQITDSNSNTFTVSVPSTALLGSDSNLVLGSTSYKGTTGSGGGLQSYITNGGGMASTLETQDAAGTRYIGFYLGAFPMAWLATGSTTNLYSAVQTGAFLTTSAAGTTFTPSTTKSCNDPDYMTYRMQYLDPNTGNWVTYDTKYGQACGSPAGSGFISTGLTSSTAPTGSASLFGAGDWAMATDPRSSRFGLLWNCSSPMGTPVSFGPDLAQGPPNVEYGFWASGGSSKWNQGWLDTANGVMFPLRPDAESGFWSMIGWPTTGSATESGTGTYPNLMSGASGSEGLASGASFASTGAAAPASGWMAYVASQGGTSATGGGTFPGLAPGLLSENNTDIVFVPHPWFGPNQGAQTQTPNYFADPDGIVRRGMGAYVPISNYSPENTASASGIWVCASADTTVGLPMARAFTWATRNSGLTSPDPTITVYPGGPTAATSQSQSRPYFLHRPFRSVAELGCVFSDTPWRNLDFFTAESGHTALLDVFCINDTNDPGGLVAGKVNLNTRQSAVLQAVIAGGYLDPAIVGNSPTSTLGTAKIDSTLAQSVAKALVARTTDTTNIANGTGPLQNVSELVGKFVQKTPILPASEIDGWNSGSNAITLSSLTSGTFYDGKLSYVGFSGGVWDTANHCPYPDLYSNGALISVSGGGVENFSSSTLAPAATPNNVPEDIYAAYMNVASSDTNIADGSTYTQHNGPQETIAYIQRFREAPIRALAAAGTTRVWNLMIDVIAQSGRFPSNTTSLANFNVEGERRYWVHVAIDRYTGKVLDEQIEEVKE